MDWTKLAKARKTIAKFLMAPGALEAKLAEAARNNDIPRATRLIADGAKIDSTQYRSDNALNIAVEQGSLEMVKLLLGAGADSNVKVSYSSTTPFLNAVFKGDAAIVEALLVAKADINAQGERGNTGFTLAVAAKNKPVAELLLKNGAKIDVRNSQGWTPLFYAARNGDVETIGQLLEKGARTDYRDENGRSALDVAKHHDRETAFQKIQDFMDAQVPEWQPTKDGQVAHVSILRAQGYRLTEIFNFETRQCKAITYNFDTRKDTVVLKSFAELGDETVAVAASKRPAPAPKTAVQP